VRQNCSIPVNLIDDGHTGSGASQSRALYPRDHDMPKSLSSRRIKAAIATIFTALATLPSLKKAVASLYISK
jgi:hypothetical protein